MVILETVLPEIEEAPPTLNIPLPIPAPFVEDVVTEQLEMVILETILPEIEAEAPPM